MLRPAAPVPALLAALLVALAPALPVPAAGQTPPTPGAPARPGQTNPAPPNPAPTILPQAPPAPATPSPQAAPATPFGRIAPPTAVPRESGLFLGATLGQNGPPVRTGIIWRIYSDPQDGSDPALLHTSQLPTPIFALDPGAYIVHATYGLAGATRRVVMGPSATTETLVINAGGLVLGGVINDVQIPPERLNFNIFVPIGNDPEGRAVISGVHGGQLIRLPEGTYRVVSTYGDSNAIANADLRVEAGRVTEATLRHRAATVTLKLVAAAGSEALANTSFSVLTPGGDTIREAIGAFPSMTLAEGEYIVIARNGGKVFTQEFTVRAGHDRDIEVIVK